MKVVGQYDRAVSLLKNAVYDSGMTEISEGEFHTKRVGKLETVC